MADIEQALADLAAGVQAVATRVQSDLAALNQEIATLEAAGADTTALQAAADSIETQVAALAAIDPAAPVSPVPPVTPAPATTFVADPATGKPTYSFIGAGSPDTSAWTPVTDAIADGGETVFTFNADADGGPATGVSADWTLYTGSLTAVVPAVTITVDQTSVSASTGQPYVGSITASGGQAPYSFSLSSLPDGLSSDAEGNVTGTPTAAGTTSVSVSVTDASGATGSGTVVFSVS